MIVVNREYVIDEEAGTKITVEKLHVRKRNDKKIEAEAVISVVGLSNPEIKSEYIDLNTIEVVSSIVPLEGDYVVTSVNINEPCKYNNSFTMKIYKIEGGSLTTPGTDETIKLFVKVVGE